MTTEPPRNLHPTYPVEPPCGWQLGFERLLHARCPYCNGPIAEPLVARALQMLKPKPSALDETPELCLSWSCVEGCNP